MTYQLLQNIEDDGEDGNVNEGEDDVAGVELWGLCQVSGPVVADERRRRVEQVGHGSKVWS